MYARLFLAVVQAAALKVAPGPSDNCPTSAQVLAALETHASDLVTPRPDDDPTKMLTLNLTPPFTGGETGFSLVDSTGLVKLYRSLPPPAGDRARDCAALADTVAFIVVRYFEEVEMPALPEKKPPPPPPPPPTPPPVPPKPEAPTGSVPPPPAKVTLSLNGGRRFPGEAFNLGGYEIKMIGGLALTTFGSGEGDLWIEASAGFAGHATYTWDQRTSAAATSDRAAADLGLLVGWRHGPGRLYVGPVAAVEVIWIDANPAGHAQHDTLVGAVAGIKTGYQYLGAGRWFARIDLTGNLAVVKQQVFTHSGVRVFDAPRMYLTLALGVGLWF